GRLGFHAQASREWGRRLTDVGFEVPSRPAGFPTELTLAAPVTLASPIDERRGGQQRGYAVNRGDDGEAGQQGARRTTKRWQPRRPGAARGPNATGRALLFYPRSGWLAPTVASG